MLCCPLFSSFDSPWQCLSVLEQILTSSTIGWPLCPLFSRYRSTSSTVKQFYKAGYGADQTCLKYLIIREKQRAGDSVLGPNYFQIFILVPFCHLFLIAQLNTSTWLRKCYPYSHCRFDHHKLSEENKTKRKKRIDQTKVAPLVLPPNTKTGQKGTVLIQSAMQRVRWIQSDWKLLNATRYRTGVK